jgi:hypothetical protein
MIALKEQTTRYEAGDDNDSYQEGYTDGFIDASGIMESDAFFEIGLALLCLAIGGLVGWAVALS